MSSLDDSSLVLWSCDATGVAWLTLNRPERGNSIVPALMHRFVELVDRADQDPGVRVLVITGAGRYFCTGLDLSSVGSGSSDPRDGAVSVLRLFRCLSDCRKPVIAAINGPVLGGGLGLVWGCDIRVAVDSAYFSFAEVKRGIVPALISAVITPQLGLFHAKQLMMTGERVSADQLHAMGALSQVVPKADLQRVLSERWLPSLLANAPNAMAVVKSMTQYEASHGPEENQAYVLNVFSRMFGSEEAQHGIGAFMAKKKPDWSGFQVKAKL